MVARGSLQGLPTPERRAIPNLAVTHGRVTTTTNHYRDVFGGGTEPGEITGIAVDSMPDGSILVWVPGTGDWYEHTALLLQLHVDADACRLLSAHVYWTADVEPFCAWSAIDGGTITLECPSADQTSPLGVAFEIRGRSPVSGAFHVPLFPRQPGIPAFAVAHLVEATDA